MKRVRGAERSFSNPESNGYIYHLQPLKEERMSKRLPLEPIVKKVGNFYETVHVAAKRARHLYTVDPYTFGKDSEGREHKKTVIALLEILEGKVCPKREG